MWTDSREDLELLYWLCFGLWQGGYFLPFLCGSVIPFIRIGELKRVIEEARQKVITKTGELFKAIETLDKLDKYQVQIKNQIDMIQEAKKAIMYKILRT